MRLHLEVKDQDVAFEKRIYSSQLCEVWKGKWKGEVVAIKRFDVENLSYTVEDLNKEIALQWFILFFF